MNRPGGKDKYRELTDLKAEEAYEIIISSPDNDTMFEKLEELIIKIKDEAYGIRTITHKKAQRESDTALILKRASEIKEALNNMDLDGDSDALRLEV